uniref:ZP domain-containing protein n=1 Tax=Salarias fasciatus TaxID=181472 RepID=A0A672HEC6_SALFA
MIWHTNNNTTQYMFRLFSLVNLNTVNAFLCLSTGTQITSCDSCHAEAFCLDQKERGDTFLGHAHSYTCLCKDGFVGDGLTCYDTKLCSDSSCCRSGYHWSPERGCVDVDECSLPDSPCNSRQICKNTPGSFECLESVSELSSGPSPFQAVCGGTVCPTGMDCILYNGNNSTPRCADPCYDYTVLNDEWRSTNLSGNGVRCDRDINWQGWYRMFQGQTSARIPERCIETNRCGTHAPLWLVEPHPTQSGVIVNRTVCNSWNGSCCFFPNHQIQVKCCYGGYYVYKLVAPSTCYLAYCSGNALTHTRLHSLNCCMYSHVFICIHFGQNAFCLLFLWNIDTTTVMNHFKYIIFELHLLKQLISFDREEGGISGLGSQPRSVMSLYSSPSFNDTYPPGSVTLPVGSPLYVGVSVEDKGPDFPVVLEDCFTSHSLSPQSPVKYPLIQNRCPVDPRQVQVIENGRSTRARFSALFFLPNGKHRAVYLHCNLSLCDRRKYSCFTVSHIRISSRSVFSSASVTPISVGPITCKFYYQSHLKTNVSSQRLMFEFITLLSFFFLLICRG